MSEKPPRTFRGSAQAPIRHRLVSSAGVAWRDALRTVQAHRRPRTGAGVFGITMMVLGLVVWADAIPVWAHGTGLTGQTVTGGCYMISGFAFYQVHRYITHPGRRRRK